MPDGGFRVVVDFDLCESNARCMETVAEVFLVDDNGDLNVLQERPPIDLRDKVELAVLRCPKGAISIVEDGSDAAVAGD